MTSVEGPETKGPVLHRVLVVTAGQPPSAELIDGLSAQGWSTTWCRVARASELMATSLGLDAVVVNLCVADIDVVTLVATADVDAAQAPLPTVVLATLEGARTRIERLPAGLNDFVLEPVDPAEVALRVMVLARRVHQAKGARTLVVGDLSLDEDSRLVHRAGQAVFLTPTEFELLRYMLSHPRRALSKAELLREVWRLEETDERHNVVELFVSYLRKKLHGDLGEPLIHTVRGVGYVLRPLQERTVT